MFDTGARMRGVLLRSCMLAVVPAGVALADEDEDGFYSLETITVEEQDSQNGAADRATAIYVSDSELDRARMGNMRELFAGLANVSVGGAIPVAQKIFVNGVDMLNLSVQMDGVLQNNRAFHHVTANAFDPGMLKFVRVDPGIAAADTGPNAVAGAVIMETVDAADVLAPGQTAGGNIRVAYSDNGSTLEGAATVAARSQGFEALGYFKSAQGDDYEDGAGNVVPGTAADMTSGLLKFAYESDQGHRLELNGQIIDDTALRPYRANIGEVIGGRPVPATRVYETKRFNYAFRYQNTQPTATFNPEVVIGYSGNEINVPNPYDSRSEATTLSAKFQNTFTLGDLGTVVAGLDYYDKDSWYSDPFDSNLTEGAKNTGLFVQGRLQHTDQLRISAGLRYDWEQFTGWDGTGIDTDGASGNISATYFITPEFSLRAGYSNVFGGIQLEDNYQFWQRWDYTGLRSARSENYTAGFDYVTNQLSVGGEYFVTKIDDARGGNTNFDFKSEGFNLGVTYGWDLGSLRLTYSNSDIEVNGMPSGSYEAQDFGAPLGQVLALQVQQVIPQWNTLVGARLDVAFDYDDTQATSGQGLDGYEVVSIWGEYHPPSLPGLMLRATVDNLFDEQYADRATYGADYASVVPLMEAGRTIRLEAVASF